VHDEVLFMHLRDSAKARRLMPDGSDVRVEPGEGEEAFNSQLAMLETDGAWRHGE
jgi:polyphosphate kinase